MHWQILQEVEKSTAAHQSMNNTKKLMVKSISRKHPNLGTQKFHRASQQQRAGNSASGTAPGAASTPLAAQNMRGYDGKVSETVGGGAIHGTTNIHTEMKWICKERSHQLHPLTSMLICG